MIINYRAVGVWTAILFSLLVWALLLGRIFT